MQHANIFCLRCTMRNKLSAKSVSAGRCGYKLPARIAPPCRDTPEISEPGDGPTVLMRGSFAIANCAMGIECSGLRRVGHDAGGL